MLILNCTQFNTVNIFIRCPPFAFKCAYGACIYPDLMCNGQADCADGSDEKPPACPETTT